MELRNKIAKIDEIMKNEYIEMLGANDEEFSLREDFYALTFFKSIQYSRCLHKIRNEVGEIETDID